MKRTVKKLAAVGLTLTSVMGLVACGSSTKDQASTARPEATKPTGTINVMCDGTVLKETDGADAFYKYLKSINGDLDLKWNRPEHSGYADAVGVAFNSNDTTPDVVLLPTDYYTLYASMGLLWDMTDAYNNSDTKKSGRLVDTAENVIKSLYVNGEDGKPAMYGFSPARGNGCVTYVKESWLKKAGYTKADAEKTLTFNEYYTMLKKMQQAQGSVVVAAAGLIGNEAPYTNYLPEFYQQAQFTFYKDNTGKYIDGFSQQAMKDALVRLQTAVKDNVLDKESINMSTSNVRDKFYADKTGVFTYWAGTWMNTITNELKNRNLDSSLVALKPIKELGVYVERLAPVWAITAKAENPEGIYKYFIDTMLDGGDIQLAWEAGAKGTQWDTKAETVTVKGDKTAGTTYTEGQFHFLPGVEKPTILYTKNHIDPLLALAKFKNGESPALAVQPQIAKDNANFFYANSNVAVPLPMTPALSDSINDINTKRKQVIADVVNNGKDVNTAMTEYTNTVGTLVEKVLKSLNK